MPRNPRRQSLKESEHAGEAEPHRTEGGTAAKNSQIELSEGLVASAAMIAAMARLRETETEAAWRKRSEAPR
jgi:hypothetical protein